MAARIVNTHEAKSRLSELIREAEQGHDVIVARNGHPVAKIIPWPPTRPERSPGTWRGRVAYHSDEIGSDVDVVELFDRSASTPVP
jgi:prevent-host-death family protein